MPSWFLRTSLRAVTNLAAGRQIRVVGPMSDVSTDDLHEVGRLLGRQSGVVVIHGVWGDQRLEAFRQGVAGNQVPPIFLQAADERAAIQQGLDLLRAGDLLLVLAEDAPAAVRLIGNRLRPRPRTPDNRTAGAA
jgi:cyanophycin synthetase